eukprot:CAMPEP_0185163258 /NCGR_PEP_ID=MMETSP1139-20130426/7733_1 /TAXON_ID=298111 /ORGANISM="Pavlova sp., Strain CCMP459" /LENGTH=101 /DNA_ID=CAMNT_0027728609 /DNA_START=808 /DNA_END=1113 /DNA_ORIENTATION=+
MSAASSAEPDGGWESVYTAQAIARKCESRMATSMREGAGHVSGDRGGMGDRWTSNCMPPLPEPRRIRRAPRKGNGSDSPSRNTSLAMRAGTWIIRPRAPAL